MNTDRFKFRVWSEKLKRYYWDYAVNVDGDLVSWGNWDDRKKEDPGEILIREQCTGLKDKNGKLIYEGDKVRILKTILYVAWNGATYFLYPDGVELTQDVMRSSTPLCWYMVHYGKKIEVIGNRHEMEKDK